MEAFTEFTGLSLEKYETDTCETLPTQCDYENVSNAPNRKA